MSRPPAIYSCLLDAKPKFVYQLWVWITTLLDEAGVEPADAYVHIVRRDHGLERGVEAYLRERGVAFRYVEPVGNGRFANRIAQLETPALREREYAVLCDTDLAVLAPLDPWIGLGGVCAKVVDVPNPPIDLLEALFRRAGFTRFPAVELCSFHDAHTYATNRNAGVCIVRTALFDVLLESWLRWLAWTAEQEDLLGLHIKHVTQISLSLALWELGEEVAPLPRIANFPTHVPPDRYDPDDAPIVLHYHDRITGEGTIEGVGVPRIDERVAAANARLAATPRPAVFDQALRAFIAARTA